MKFVAAPAVIAMWALGSTVDAIFAAPKRAQIVSAPSCSGWLMSSSLRGGSMGKLLVSF